MFGGWRDEEWMRTAWVVAGVMNASMNRKRGHTFTPMEFHPFMRIRRRGTPLNKNTVRLLWAAMGRKVDGR